MHYEPLNYNSLWLDILLLNYRYDKTVQSRLHQKYDSWEKEYVH